MSGREVSEAEDDGWFRFHALAAGKVALHVEADDHLPSSREVEVVEGKETKVEIRLDPGASITGVLLDAKGEPQAGVRVGVDLELPDPLSGWTAITARIATTDAEGRFALHALLPGRYELEARQETYGLTGAVEVVAPAKDVVVRGRWLGKATLRFLLPDGSPLDEGVWVWRKAGGGYASGSLEELDDGRIEIEGLSEEPRSYDFVVEGYAPVSRALRVTPGTAAATETITLDPGVTLEGRVLTPDGTPAAGADIRAGRLPIETAEDGTFVLEHAPRGLLHLSVKAGDAPRTWFVVDVGATKAPLDLAVRRGATIDLRMEDAEGEPAANQQVSYDHLVDGTWERTGGGRTGPDGHMRGPVASGRIRFLWHATYDAVPVLLGETSLAEGETRTLVFAVPR
jgi:5-hydroxyisourate hydrolase-like protein (transthyretin family)